MQETASSTKPKPKPKPKPNPNLSAKPNPNPNPHQVGDRLDTDILFGQNNGLLSCLTLSGVTTEAKLLSKENTVKPDFYVGSIAEFM